MTSIDDSQVKSRLLAYLARLCDRTDIAYAAGLDRISGGRDAAIFGFELSPAPARFSGHPLNILADHGRVTGIIDWENVVIAPPEMDVGSALANIATVPFGGPPLLRPVVRALVWFLLRKYLRSYRRRRPLDDAAISYFQVFRAMAQLAAVGRSLAEGQAGGAFQSEAGVRNLTAHIRGLTGLEPRLELSQGI